MWNKMDRWLAVCVTLSAISHVTSTGCTNQWYSRWFNSHVPSFPGNRNDSEPLPVQSMLDTICPSGTGTLVAQCEDENKEPFDGSKDDANYHATCTPSDGMRCAPKPGVNSTCPDISLQLGCCKPTTTVATNQQKGTQAPSAVTQNPGVSSNSQNGATGSANHVTKASSAANPGTQISINGQNGATGGAKHVTTPSRSASGSGAHVASNGPDGHNGAEATGISIFLLLSACFMLLVLMQ